MACPARRSEEQHAAWHGAAALCRVLMGRSGLVNMPSSVWSSGLGCAPPSTACSSSASAAAGGASSRRGSTPVAAATALLSLTAGPFAGTRQAERPVKLRTRWPLFRGRPNGMPLPFLSAMLVKADSLLVVVGCFASRVLQVRFNLFQAQQLHAWRVATHGRPPAAPRRSGGPGACLHGACFAPAPATASGVGSTRHCCGREACFVWSMLYAHINGLFQSML